MFSVYHYDTLNYCMLYAKWYRSCNISYIWFFFLRQKVLTSWFDFCFQKTLEQTDLLPFSPRTWAYFLVDVSKAESLSSWFKKSDKLLIGARYSDFHFFLFSTNRLGGGGCLGWKGVKNTVKEISFLPFFLGSMTFAFFNFLNLDSVNCHRAATTPASVLEKLTFPANYPDQWPCLGYQRVWRRRAAVRVARPRPTIGI